MDKNNAVALWNQHGAETYPIAGFTYVFVRKDLSTLQDKAKAEALASFLKWATHSGQALATQLDYAPLSTAVQEVDAHALEQLNFGGMPLAMSAK
jgi:ABC-type phosphate transport system substrate-binding protein